MHTTELASECMWKAHKSAGKMRHSTFQYNHLTLTYVIFHVNRNTFRSFLKFYVNNFWHSTQLSSLTIPAKYPETQRSERHCIFNSTCILDCFSWPFGPSETIYPKNSFRTTHNVDTLETSKPKKLFCNCPQHSFDYFLVVWIGFVFQATPKLWSISENISKNHQV